jgi:predicted nucleic acid-binding protein
VATCGIIELEVLYSAVSARDLVAIRRNRAAAFPRVEMTGADFRRAEAVMEALAEAGRHRAAGIPDLLIAAVAERAGIRLLHYDEDFEHIASVTRQPVQWVVGQGSVP